MTAVLTLLFVSTFFIPAAHDETDMSVGETATISSSSWVVFHSDLDNSYKPITALMIREFILRNPHWESPTGITLSNTKLEVADEKVEFDSLGSVERADGIRVTATCDVSVQPGAAGDKEVFVTLPGLSEAAILLVAMPQGPAIEYHDMPAGILLRPLPSGPAIESHFLLAIRVSTIHVHDSPAAAQLVGSGREILRVLGITAVMILIVLAWLHLRRLY